MTWATRARHGRPAAVLGAVTLLLTACGTGDVFGESERLSADCAVVLDGSGSGNDDKKGFGAQAKLDAKLVDFLDDQKCKYLSYAPITSASVASSCQVARVDIDPDEYTRSDRTKLWDTTRAIAKTGADRMLKCARERQPGSDVLGGLQRVTAVPREKPDSTFHVLVISDFDQADPDFRLSKYDLDTQARRDTAVKDLVAARGLPDLPHTTVHRVGFAMTGTKTNPERVHHMEQFWQQLLEKEVKVDVDDGYGT
jgi:hypothetical protein